MSTATHDLSGMRKAARSKPPCSFFGTSPGRNKTEQQLEQTISELRDRTRLMETVFDSMDEGVAVSDAEGGMLFFNPSAERIIGLGAVESGPDEWSDVYGAFYPDGETRVPTDQLPLVRALRGETTDGLELFVRNDKNREGSHVSAKGRFITGDDSDSNKIKAGVVVFSDISEHKKQEARLQETIGQTEKGRPNSWRRSSRASATAWW